VVGSPSADGGVSPYWVSVLVYFVMSSGSTFEINDNAFSCVVGVAEYAADNVPSELMIAIRSSIAESFLFNCFIFYFTPLITWYP
jgi:hypothetical protein